MTNISRRLGPVALGWKGLGAVTLADAGVRVRGDGVVRVPYFDASGREWNAKLFGPSGRSWWERRGLGVAVYGLDWLAQPSDRARRNLWVAEGESDTLCLREHYATWRDLPVDVIGLPGAGTWRAEWVQHLRGYAAVYTFADADQAGERMASAISASARWAMTVRLPDGSDVRDLLQRDGPDQLDQQIVAAEGVALMFAVFRECSNLDEARRFLAEVEW